MGVFRPFPALAQKIYFIHFFQTGKNITSFLKWNIQIPPPLLSRGLIYDRIGKGKIGLEGKIGKKGKISKSDSKIFGTHCNLCKK